MPKYEIQLQAEAVTDIQNAFDWYEEERAGLGSLFINELEISLGKISENPFFYSSVNNWARKIKVNRFPFLIIYETERSAIIVNAVRHIRRRPRH
jgi:toxin ParE1/3/4